MRHRVKGKKLGRDTAHRKALLRNLSVSLILHGKIETTLAKAKYVRPFVEKIVTKAKRGGLNNVRLVKRDITDDRVVRKLFEQVAPKFAEIKGGYTRIVKLGFRPGDNAEMARIEWAEKIIKEKEKKAPAKKVKKESKK